MKHYNKEAKKKFAAQAFQWGDPRPLLTICSLLYSWNQAFGMKCEVSNVDHYQEHEPQTNFGHDIGKEFKEATNYYLFVQQHEIYINPQPFKHCTKG